MANNYFTVSGNWGQWTNWGSYGYNKQTRVRNCDYPEPSCGGQMCYGDDKQIRVLNSKFSFCW